MNRRRYLAVAAGAIGGLAGCSGGGTDDVTTAPATQVPTATGTPTNAAGSGGGDGELPVPESELTRGAAKDAIPAITDPAFGPDWGDTQYELTGESRVIGVDRDGEARAYPLRVLNYHEIVNDDFAGPLLVTFCPLCGSGVTGVRRVGGEATIFGVSGLLWKSDLVMYDRRTESLWSQIRAQAIRGPRTGERIELVPSTLTTWETWRTEYPDTAVLLPPPASGTIGAGDGTRNYDRDPYAGYADSPAVGIGDNDFEDSRLPPKTRVIGVEHGGVARAYPLPRVTETGVVNDEVGGLPVVVTTDPGGALVAYERTVDGETLTFERADDRHLIAGGSRWNVATGEAVGGPFDGTTLARANDVSPEFWFAWASFHPETGVYGE